MEWDDVLLAAAAFFLVVTALSLSFLLLRLAATLTRVNALLASMERDGIPLLERVAVTLDQVTTTLDQVNRQLGKVDTLLDSAVGGVQSADRTARSVSRVVGAPIVRLAEASALVRGSVSGLLHRRGARPGSGRG
jgi:uncharacterized protein YoxC